MTPALLKQLARLLRGKPSRQAKRAKAALRRYGCKRKGVGGGGP